MGIRAYYGYDYKAVSDETALSDFGPSKTVQSQKDEADINTIVRNFGVTGKMPTAVRAPMFGDFTGVDDYRSAIEVMRDAEESFSKMPSAFRFELGNDPQKFVEFCSDVRNLDRMKELGLVVLPPESASGASV